MILDFNNLSITNKKLFDKCYVDMQYSFVELLDNIDQNTSKNHVKYFQTIFSRSILESDLVYDCTVLYFLNTNFNCKNKLKKIIVSNSQLKKNIRSKKSFEGIEIYVKTKNFSLFLNFLKKYLYIFLRNIPFAVMSIFSANKKRKISKKKDFILLDTFITSSMIKKTEFTDRYYTNIENYFDSNIKDKLYYLPTMPLYFTKNDLVKIYKKSNKKLIFKQDYLNIFDYIKPYKLLKEIKFKKDVKFFYEGFDITKSIKSELKRNKFKSYRAILDLIFVQKFCSEDNTPDTFINWNENRSTGKALVSGFHKYSQTTYTKGYQGFQSSSDYHFYICPTELEVRNNLIPMEIGVVGNGFKDRLYKFTNNFKVELAPSFRQAKYITKLENVEENEKIKLIVLMSSDESCIEYLFEILNEISEKLILLHNLEFYFKPHPISNFRTIRKHFDKFNLKNINRTHFIENLSIEEILDFSDLVVGIKTGAIFEFISNGIPSIVIANNGITENPIPQSIPHELWKLTYSSDELLHTISDFIIKIKNKHQFIDVEKFRNQFYIKPSVENVHSFLSLY